MDIRQEIIDNVVIETLEAKVETLERKLDALCKYMNYQSET